MKETEDKLIEENMRLAYWTAQKFKGCGIEQEDLNGIALLGLVKAARAYDEQKGAFTAFAIPVMRNRIQKFKGCGIEQEDLNGIALLGLVKAARAYDEQKGAFTAFAIPVMRNRILMELRRNKRCAKAVSLDAEITAAGDEKMVSLGEMIPYREQGYERVEAALTAPRLMQGLKEKERKAVYLILCRGLSQRDAGRALGVSQSAVSRFIKSAKEKMRNCGGEGGKRSWEEAGQRNRR